MFFKESKSKTIEYQIINKPFIIKSKYKNNISLDLQNLLIKMLQKDPNKRVTIEEVLFHKVFKKFHEERKKYFEIIKKDIRENGIF